MTSEVRPESARTSKPHSAPSIVGRALDTPLSGCHWLEPWLFVVGNPVGRVLLRLRNLRLPVSRTLSDVA